MQNYCMVWLHFVLHQPIKGPEGNIEYLVYIRKEAEGSREESVDVHAVGEAAHGELDK